MLAQFVHRRRVPIAWLSVTVAPLSVVACCYIVYFTQQDRPLPLTLATVLGTCFAAIFTFAAVLASLLGFLMLKSTALRLATSTLVAAYIPAWIWVHMVTIFDGGDGTPNEAAFLPAMALSALAYLPFGLVFWLLMKQHGAPFFNFSHIGAFFSAKPKQS